MHESGEVVILDNGLISFMEHSFRLNLQVTRELSRRDVRFRLYSTSKVDSSIAAELPAIPHFKRDLYDSVWVDNSWPNLNGEPSNWGVDEYATYRQLNASFFNDLASLPKNVWNANNRIVIPAISQNQIGGLVDFLLGPGKCCRSKIIAQLMFSPDWVPWGVRAKHGPDFYRIAFTKAGRLIDTTLQFTTENEFIADIYRHAYDLETRILPVPFEGRPSTRLPNRRPKLGFLGYSKADKGFHLIPDAILQCRSMGLEAEFVVQINHGSWEPATVAADQKLRAIQDVEILEGQLSAEDYANAFSRLDAVLLPYDPELFGLRGSGVFTEATSAGLPLIASHDTWAAKCIEAGVACGEVFRSFDSQSFAKAIQRAIGRFEELSRNAQELSAPFAAKHSASRYVDIITDAWSEAEIRDPVENESIPMTSSVFSGAAEQRKFAGTASEDKFTLPLVSVIVINYNYGHFLKQTVASVMEQTYPNIECVIVDDASTDNTEEVLQELQVKYKGLKVSRRRENAGQCAAAAEGYRIGSGKYVIFLDADDVLLPDFIAAHIFVHLSMSDPVGVTSCDLLQASGTDIVVGSFQNLSKAFRAVHGKENSPLRSIARVCPQLWNIEIPIDVDSEAVFVPSTEMKDWIWAPTSGNCFRRDALALFMECDALPTRFHLDSYLMWAIHSMTGSVIISRPLWIYRIHSENAFSACPHLNGLVTYDLKDARRDTQNARKLIIDHIVRNYEYFGSRFFNKSDLEAVLNRINDVYPPLVSSNGFSRYSEKLLKIHHRTANEADDNVDEVRTTEFPVKNKFQAFTSGFRRSTTTLGEWASTLRRMRRS